MRIKTLGWARGIGASLCITACLFDDDMLINAGTGLGDMPLNDMIYSHGSNSRFAIIG
jgi:hypothetical protein